MTKKDPPDKYKTIKCPLNNILRNANNHDRILDAICRTNKIVTNAYQFIRLYLLYNYNNCNPLIELNKDVIKLVFKALIVDSRGQKVKGNNAVLLNKFIEFYNNQYKYILVNKIDATNLSHILEYTSIGMITNIENNIKLNFIAYIKRFVNSSFKLKNNNTISKKELDKDLYEIKQDLLNNTLLCKNIYHEWIIKHRNNILPDGNFDIEDLNNNPQKYIKCMIYMCLEIEKLGTKLFQFMPIRSNFILKYIPIDTSILIDLLIDKQALYFLTEKYKNDTNIENKIIFTKKKKLLVKNDLNNNIDYFKNEIWYIYFKLDYKVFKYNKYSFDYKLSTDGYAVSLQMIKNIYIEGEINKKKNIKNKRKEKNEIYSNFTIEEKEEYIKTEKLKKKNEIEKRRKENKEKYKQLSKEEKIKVIKTMNKNDYTYIDDLNKEQYNDLINKDWVVVDPGKKNLLSMMSNKGVYLRYTNKQHIFLTKRKKYQDIINKYKVKYNIYEYETELSKYNLKTCNYSIFRKSITERNKYYDTLIELYKNNIFRKYKWYSYINKKRAESNIVNTIEKKYGKNINIIYGDWSNGKQMKNFISTPNISLKRKIAEKFNVYNIDEYNTSKLHYITEEKTENLYLPDKKGVSRKIHSILTYKMENNRSGCINRDMNAIKNMIKIVEYYIEYRKRPEKYKRGIIKNSFNL